MGCSSISIGFVIDSSKEGNNEKFDKIKLLGEGKLSKVFLIKSQMTQKKYVLKEIIVNNPNLESIAKEAENLKILYQQNIIQFKSAFITKSPNYILNIITEFIDKGDLSKEIFKHKMQNKHFEEKQLLDWIIQSCLALLYIQKNKIIHGNIKPTNIFLTKNNCIKIGDFGIFKKIFNIDYDNLYLAPELFEKKEYSYKVDIWSLGVVFCHLMALEFPFEGSNKEEVYKNILKGEKNKKILNKDKTNYNENILQNYSQEFLDLIDEMMSLDPMQRPMPEDIMKKNIFQNRMDEYLDKNYASKKRTKFRESIIAPNINTEDNNKDTKN